jgi:hypothetical protein
MIDLFNLPYWPVGPANPHNFIVRWRTIWKKCRDVIAGEEQIKDAGEQYLTKMVRMSDSEYEAYKHRALFYGASSRTIQGLLGSLLRKPPIVHTASPAVDAKLDKYLQNITQTRVDLAGFARDLVQEVLTVGRVGVLVDMPPEDANLLDPTPYARMYTAENVINWREHFEGGVPVLDEVVLVEILALPSANGFGVEFIIQYRELVLNEDGSYVQRLWVIDPPADEDHPATYRMVDEIMPLYRGQPLKHLPFFFCNSSHTRPDIEKPPLLDLFNVNLSHYRSSADLEHGRHFTAIPTPVVAGVDTSGEDGVPPSLEIGSATAWMLPFGATAHMLEFNGQGLKHLENALDEKMALMASLGARMLEPDKRASETAEALRLRQAGDIANLNTIADIVGETLTQVVRVIAWWSYVIDDPEDKTMYIELDKDYFESRLSPSMLAALVQAWQSGALGFSDLYTQLVRGEAIDDSRTLEQVKAEVTAEVKLRQEAFAAAQGTQKMVAGANSLVTDKLSVLSTGTKEGDIEGTGRGAQ